tara:strand:+ start:1156 stop:1368 length:213 start_codon:yes stop_codon:yes gene_type:complete
MNVDPGGENRRKPWFDGGCFSEYGCKHRSKGLFCDKKCRPKARGGSTSVIIYRALKVSQKSVIDALRPRP